MQQDLPRYAVDRTYAWNFEQAPQPVEVAVPEVNGDWTFCGLPVDSPLGIPAGPLLNGNWILYYASLGFDVLTYKTVRSIERECYPLPNLQPVICKQLTGKETDLPVSQKMLGSWAVSFGMPSKTPSTWRADVEQTRNALDSRKLLSVSVVGSVQDGWSIDDLANDYAKCARWAVESGADCVETNFSCPNVSTCDGQIYQQPEQAGLVAETVRAGVGKAPFIIKIGHVTKETEAIELLNAVEPFVDAIALTNSVATTVNDNGARLFGGAQRGICGDATRNASIAQTRLFSRLIDERQLSIRLIGVGGISTAAHVRDYLAAGAEATHIATAAMTDPGVAISIRNSLRIT